MKNFSNYFKILEKIKNQGNVDFIRMDHNDHKIILKLIDDSDETVNFVTELRKKHCICLHHILILLIKEQNSGL